MSNERTIEFDNVGPIERLEIDCPEDGGLIVLEGRNGIGKTTALNGIESLYNKDKRKTMEKSDVVPIGSITGLGVKVTLGKSNSIRGKLCCEAIDGHVDPSYLAVSYTHLTLPTTPYV